MIISEIRFMEIIGFEVLSETIFVEIANPTKPLNVLNFCFFLFKKTILYYSCIQLYSAV